MTTSDVERVATLMRNEHASRSFGPGTSRDPLDFWRADGRFCNTTLKHSQFILNANEIELIMLKNHQAICPRLGAHNTFSDAFKLRRPMQFLPHLIVTSVQNLFVASGATSHCNV